MAENISKWPKIFKKADNIKKWPKIFEMAQNIQNWSKILKNRRKYPKMAENIENWPTKSKMPELELFGRKYWKRLTISKMAKLE